MRVLALDAAGLSCSAALLEDEQCLICRHGGDSRAATAQLPRLVGELLAAPGGPLDIVAVTVGPGSFTGLRGAIALAQGLALGAGVPVIGVTVAEALRHGLDIAGPVWVALDARRSGRVFLDSGHGMAACTLDALPSPPGAVTVLGDAADAVCAVVAGAVPGPRRVVCAADVGRVALRRFAGEMGPCEAQPLYVEGPAASGQPAAA